MGAQPFGDLDRERANAAGTARNEGLLSRLHAEFVSQRLERGQRRKGHARRFLEIHVGTQDEGTFAAQWLAYALPVNASPMPSRAPAHDSGSMRFAIPSS
jgi:hypothetical protein